MKEIPLVHAKAGIDEYIEACTSDGPLVFTRKGKAIAILRPPLDDEELYRLRLACNPAFRAMMERAEHSIDEGRGLSHAEFWRLVEERAAKRERAKKKKPKKQPA